MKETVPASRKLGATEAADLVKAASKIYVAKGKNLSEHKGGAASEEVVAALLGPTGNLRAPTLKIGKTLLVGFDEETYTRVLG